MPYICEGWFEIDKMGCGDSAFWQVVQMREIAIDPLMELLNDTTKTQVYFPNYGGLMTVADIAQTALGEIIQVLPNPGDFFDIKPISGSAWMGWLSWLQSDVQNRDSYKEALTAWYKQYQANFVWTSSNRFRYGDVRGTHPNGGHLELKEENK